MTTKQITQISIGAAAVTLTTVLFFVFKKKFKDKKSAKASKEYAKTTYKTVTNTGVKSSLNLTETADTIANGLGISYSAFNPQSWTENDTDVYNALKLVPKELIANLSDIYAKKYKRNLREDLNKYLDPALYAKIKNLLY